MYENTGCCPGFSLVQCQCQLQFTNYFPNFVSDWLMVCLKTQLATVLNSEAFVRKLALKVTQSLQASISTIHYRFLFLAPP